MEKAVLRQAPRLAWITAQAFTRGRSGPGKWPALVAYPVHLVIVTMAIMDGTLYRTEHQATVVVKSRNQTHLKGVLLFGALVVALLLAAFLLAEGEVGVLDLLALVLLLVLAVVFLISAVSMRSRHGSDTSPALLRKALDGASMGRPAFMFEMLARSPDARTGVGSELLTQALDELAGDGAAVGCIAANQELISFYNRFGLQQIGQSQMMLNPDWATSGRGEEK